MPSTQSLANNISNYRYMSGHEKNDFHNDLRRVSGEQFKEAGKLAVLKSAAKTGAFSSYSQNGSDLSKKEEEQVNAAIDGAIGAIITMIIAARFKIPQFTPKNKTEALAGIGLGAGLGSVTHSLRGLAEHAENDRKAADLIAQYDISPFGNDDENPVTVRSPVGHELGSWGPAWHYSESDYKESVNKDFL
ncbi:MAG: hypothetical protein ACPGSM_12710 [Thiolinea sp.]